MKQKTKMVAFLLEKAITLQKYNKNDSIFAKQHFILKLFA
jgi:hypothetical protein